MNVAVNGDTLSKIVSCSKQEFLAHGFKDSSLRRIAAEAGLTTGAIYGYFKNKNEIFEHIVSPLCDKLDEFLKAESDTYTSTVAAPGEISVEKSIRSAEAIYAVLYANLDETKLLTDCAEGSSRANYFHKLIDYDASNTLAYIAAYKKYNGSQGHDIDEFLAHTLAESYANSLLEPIRHNMNYEDALKNVRNLSIFYTCGWEALLKG